MMSTTPSLFEQEMQDQIEAAEAAVVEASTRGDALLEQAARNHLESLVDLARRNGLEFTPSIVTIEPIIARTLSSSDGAAVA